MVSLGVFESIKGTQVVKRLIKRVIETMDEEEPDVVLQIGLPVFGFRLLEIAKYKSIPVVYYYTPLSRGLENVKVERFAGVVDKVASISRFETNACQEAGIDVEFVGHPLLDLAEPTKSKGEARELLELSQTSSVISILPGAREVEVKNVLPTVLKSLCQVQKSEDDIEIVISVVRPFVPPQLKELLIRVIVRT